VTTVLLVRHGRTAANAGGLLVGWTAGVSLDDRGHDQAAALAARIAALPLAAVVSSPLQRCVETATVLLTGRQAPALEIDDRLGECRYGDWTGKELRRLARDPLWKVVQAHPSGATFPGPDGESMAAMQARAVAAVRSHNARLGADATWVAVSHGDVIKAIVADALGLHLDLFQRIVVDPCSLSVIRYTDSRPFLLRVNDTGAGIDALLPPKRRRRTRRSSDAVVGGGAGPA
jgi:probable phosphomutase (TIGR03848 family)